MKSSTEACAIVETEALPDRVRRYKTEWQRNWRANNPDAAKASWERSEAKRKLKTKKSKIRLADKNASRVLEARHAPCPCRETNAPLRRGIAHWAEAYGHRCPHGEPCPGWASVGIEKQCAKCTEARFRKVNIHA